MAENLSNEVWGFVHGRIDSLTQNLGSSEAKARLARLRRGAGKLPGELPELWGEFLQNMPQVLLSKSDKPSYAEWAVYTALTLFALHQQGHSEPMNSEGELNRIGRAVRTLANISGSDAEERICFKLRLAANSDDMEELSYRLRGLIKLLSNEAIPLDYADLACDLYQFQFSEDSANKVRLKWGRNFYYEPKDNGRKDDSNEN